MNRLTARRLSPATVISCIALFVSLGGVSYGVATGFIDTREIQDETIRSQDVRNNSLRTQDVRNNEVRGRDIRNSTVTGRDVGLNSLTGLDIQETSFTQKVPVADTLDGIDSTGFVPADTQAVAPLPLGGAGAEAAGEAPPEFDLDPLGYVHLQGVIEVGPDAGALAILPVGARPAAERHFAVYGDPAVGPAALTLVRVETDGSIRPEATAAIGDQFALDGITFRAGA